MISAALSPVHKVLNRILKGCQRSFGLHPAGMRRLVAGYRWCSLRSTTGYRLSSLRDSVATGCVFGGVPCDQLPRATFFIPEGFQDVAGDKRSAITGAQGFESHPERMPA